MNAYDYLETLFDYVVYFMTFYYPHFDTRVPIA